MRHLYIEGNRLFRIKKPIVAAVHGAAVGGGLGLAMVADFRVTCPEARFSANFTRLGFHPGFGLTVTLPAVIGPSKAALMFYTSRRLTGDEAHAMGLADVLVPQEQVREAALALAAEIAENSPLGLIATRAACAATSPSVCSRRPTTSSPSRRGCARPTTSRKASRRWRSGGGRSSADVSLPSFRDAAKRRARNDQPEAIRCNRSQICSGTILIAPQGHSAAHMPQPLQ